MTDLGAWPAEQATVLVDVLQRAGLQPEAKRTRDGIHVVVPDAESDQAHQILVANMDAIARAARPSAPGGRRRDRGAARSRGEKARGERGRDGDRRRGEQGSRDPKLTSERLSGMAPALGLLLLVVMVAAIAPPVRLPVMVLGVGAVIWLLGKQSQRDGDD